jgi:hypothetical protein
MSLWFFQIVDCTFVDFDAEDEVGLADASVKARNANDNLRIKDSDCVPTWRNIGNMVIR